MQIFCVQGLQAGVGASSFVANIARSLLELNQQVLIFDLNPSNLLRLHFNMDWENPNGWALNLQNQKPWHEAGFRCEHGLVFVPFGQLDYQAHQRLIVEYLNENKLREQLDALDLPDKTWLILNISSDINPLTKQVLELSQLVVRVFEPTVTGLSALINSMQSLYYQQHKPLTNKTFYVINKLLPSSEMDFEMTLVFKNLLLKRLLPISVHFDENVKEALANQTTVNIYAPNSAAAKEFRTLSIWLMSYLNRLNELR